MKQSTKGLPRALERAVDKLPTISPVVGKIQEIADSLETSPKDLVKIIMLDPILTGKVIQLVNSSYYGLPNKVKSLAQAVVLLGQNTVKNLAISTAVLSSLTLESRYAPIDPSSFWKHCLATAVAAKSIARQYGAPRDELETYFIAGLLHDLGKVLLMRAEPAKYRAILKESREHGVTVGFSERAHHACTHTQAGGRLAKKWRLGDDVTLAIEHHHSGTSTAGNSDLVRIVVLANNLSKKADLGVSGNTVIEESAFDFARQMGLSAEVLREIVDKLPDELGKAEAFLGVRGKDGKQ